MEMEPLLIIANAHYRDLVDAGNRARAAAAVAKQTDHRTPPAKRPLRALGSAMIRTGSRLAGTTRLDRTPSPTG
jgi:hypothetical protein